MQQNLLLAMALTLSIITNQSAATEPNNQKDKAQTFGILKFNYDDKNRFTIVHTEHKNTYMPHKDLFTIFGNYSKKYFQLSTDEAKAKLAYQVLLKIALKTNFKVAPIEDLFGNQAVAVTTFEEGLEGALRNPLIPAQDMLTVYPLFIKMLKKSYFSLQWLKYDQNVDLKMPMDNLNWPSDEYWFDDWFRWVDAELRGICYTSDGERLCSEWGTSRSDSNGDGEIDQICGHYSNYHGATEKAFHCVHR